MPRFFTIRPALVALMLIPALPAGAATIDIFDSSGIVGMAEGPLEQAITLIGTGDLAEAEAITRRVIADTPDSAAAHEVLGIILALRDQVPAAIDALERATDLNPDQFTAWTKLGDIAQALGDEGQASALYRRALALAPDDPLTNQRIGLYLARHDQIGAAITHLEKGIIDLPDDVPGLRIDLAQLYLRADEPQKALDLLAAWGAATERSAPISAAVLAVQGEALLATGDPSQAAERFRAVLAAKPDDVPALVGLGRAERALGDVDGAMQTLTHAAEIAPDDPAAQIELATSEAEAGQGDAAKARLDRLVDATQQPGSRTLAAAARLYGAMGHYEGAHDSYARAIEAQPDDPALRAGMTMVLLRLGDQAAALEQARKRLELAPRNPDAAFMSGMLEESAGKREAASTHYGQALESNPDHWPSLNNLALIRLSENRIEDALALALRAEKAMPDNPTILDTLAQIYETGGEGDRAAETRLQIAETYLVADRPDDAKKALEEAAATATDPALRDRIAARLEAL